MTSVPTRWQRSSFSSGAEGTCVELAQHDAGLLLRESDAPRSVVMTSAARLAALLGGVKGGRFDGLSARQEASAGGR
ncbi:DUF397 domain-containing protein [Streptomyces sp. NBC_01803]|uniref:DUF397 domain-containing protein n=1 Tax=Streptomyces sp. NBC_01803 TaxID=2975946 RepID=UPI002DDAA82D|nr:DUF397 domain-containing protein [Streptomyces sp. NBC_01803]WSA44781.1 DUF397 domain-containing protein [Streptomyces sp. NBC_01803]